MSTNYSHDPESAVDTASTLLSISRSVRSRSPSNSPRFISHPAAELLLGLASGSRSRSNSSPVAFERQNSHPALQLRSYNNFKDALQSIDIMPDNYVSYVSLSASSSDSSLETPILKRKRTPAKVDLSTSIAPQPLSLLSPKRSRSAHNPVSSSPSCPSKALNVSLQVTVSVTKRTSTESTSTTIRKRSNSTPQTPSVNSSLPLLAANTSDRNAFSIKSESKTNTADVLKASHVPFSSTITTSSPSPTSPKDQRRLRLEKRRGFCPFLFDSEKAAIIPDMIQIKPDAPKAAIKIFISKLGKRPIAPVRKQETVSIKQEAGFSASPTRISGRLRALSSASEITTPLSPDSPPSITTTPVSKRKRGDTFPSKLKITLHLPVELRKRGKISAPIPTPPVSIPPRTPWSDAEKIAFHDALVVINKRDFYAISALLNGSKSTAECVDYYYRNKMSLGWVLRRKERKRVRELKRVGGSGANSPPPGSPPRPRFDSGVQADTPLTDAMTLERKLSNLNTD